MNDFWNDENLIKTIRNGGVAIMPTDTLYGIVGKALDESVVERIYSIKQRKPDKPCIILIGDIEELKNFSVILSLTQESELKKYWPGPTSIILDCYNDSLEYLHRGTKTLAFRLPTNTDLQNLLKKTGPLIAPSANPEGLPPVQNIKQAQEYFNNLIDLYINGGEISGQASKVLRLHKDGSISILRE